MSSERTAPGNVSPPVISRMRVDLSPSLLLNRLADMVVVRDVPVIVSVRAWLPGSDVSRAVTSTFVMVPTLTPSLLARVEGEKVYVQG